MQILYRPVEPVLFWIGVGSVWTGTLAANGLRFTSDHGTEVWSFGPSLVLLGGVCLLLSWALGARLQGIAAPPPGP